MTFITRPILAFTSLAIFSAQVSAIAQPYQVACDAIKAVAPTYYQGDDLYTEDAKNYWNAQLKAFLPACIIRPKNADQVSAAVKVLNKYPEVKFVVKSGGHDPNPGHSSTPDGILLSLTDIRGVHLVDDKSVAHVKPGGHWDGVIGPLDTLGYTVVGGRLGVVGIGGYLTGGGLSFLSAAHGMAADTIVGWELVMANGTIANVTPQSHPELAIALKGSALNYGIVTKFTMKAFPIGQIWGGIRVYVSKHKDEIFQGLHEFINNPNADPKAAVIVESMHAPFKSQVIMIHFFYNGTTPPPNAFGRLQTMVSTVDMTKARTYTDLMKFNGYGVNDLNSNTAFRSRTMPFIANNPKQFNEVDDQFGVITKPFQASRFITAGTLAFQAFPKSIGKLSEAAGGNAMGLTSHDQHRFVIEQNWIFEKDSDAQTIVDLGDKFVGYLDQKVKTVTQSSTGANGTVESYLPLFLNDAASNQDVMASYKNFQSFKNLQRQMDPQGLWHSRAGGFKYN